MILASIGRGRNEGVAGLSGSATGARAFSTARVRNLALPLGVVFLRDSACSLAMTLSRVRLARLARLEGAGRVYCRQRGAENRRRPPDVRHFAPALTANVLHLPRGWLRQGAGWPGTGA